MVDIEDAGVTFYLDDSELVQGNTDHKGKKYVGKAVVSATVRDTELWGQVLEQINGLLLYKGNDLKTELINVLQNKANRLAQNLESREAELIDQVQKSEQRASLAEAGRVRAEQRIRILETELERLKELEQQLNNLSM